MCTQQATRSAGGEGEEFYLFMKFDDVVGKFLASSDDRYLSLKGEDSETFLQGILKIKDSMDHMRMSSRAFHSMIERFRKEPWQEDDRARLAQHTAFLALMGDALKSLDPESSGPLTSRLLKERDEIVLNYPHLYTDVDEDIEDVVTLGGAIEDIIHMNAKSVGLDIEEESDRINELMDMFTTLENVDPLFLYEALLIKMEMQSACRDICKENDIPIDSGVAVLILTPYADSLLTMVRFVVESQCLRAIIDLPDDEITKIIGHETPGRDNLKRFVHPMNEDDARRSLSLLTDLLDDKGVALNVMMEAAIVLSELGLHDQCNILVDLALEASEGMAHWVTIASNAALFQAESRPDTSRKLAEEIITVGEERSDVGTKIIGMIVLSDVLARTRDRKNSDQTFVEALAELIDQPVEGTVIEALKLAVLESLERGELKNARRFAEKGMKGTGGRGKEMTREWFSQYYLEVQRQEQALYKGRKR